MLILIGHPLIEHKLGRLRHKDTGTREFRQNMHEIAGLMTYEITRDLPVKKVTIETPLASCTASELGGPIVLVPILRAGLGMAEGIIPLIPNAKVGHVGLYRDHETLEPERYYTKFPKGLRHAMVLVLDPMLATGGSASAAIRIIKEAGATRIKLVSIVGAPEGVQRMEKDHPDVDIYLAALDEGLNDIGYILPGLGDAGDRLLGTDP